CYFCPLPPCVAAAAEWAEKCQVLVRQGDRAVTFVAASLSHKITYVTASAIRVIDRGNERLVEAGAAMYRPRPEHPRAGTAAAAKPPFSRPLGPPAPPHRPPHVVRRRRPPPPGRSAPGRR